MYGVTITELIKKMKMKNVLPEIDTDKVVLSHPDANIAGSVAGIKGENLSVK